jgi:nitrous oxide reductase accessory protein NosL
MKKVLTLGLAVVFGTALLAGCAKKEESAAPAEQPAVVEETTTTSTETSTATTDTGTMTGTETTTTMTETTTTTTATPPPAN